MSLENKNLFGIFCIEELHDILKFPGSLLLDFAMLKTMIKLNRNVHDSALY